MPDAIVAAIRRRLRPLRRLARWGQQRVHDALPDRWALERRFRKIFGRAPELRHPVEWPDKMYWSLRYHRDPRMTRCSDKVAVRGFVAECGGAGILNTCYGVWTDPASIPFAALPSAFVLKVAGGWNAMIRCPDKATLDVVAACRQLRAWLARSNYWWNREWVYKDIPPRILAEADLGENPPDYKIFCFAGEPGFIQVDVDRFSGHKRECFWPDWTPAPFRFQTYPAFGSPVPAPSNLADMLAWARRLSAAFPFVRVDLYSVAGRTVFGELSWQPEGGSGQFYPAEWNHYWGERLPFP